MQYFLKKGADFSAPPVPFHGRLSAYCTYLLRFRTPLVSRLANQLRHGSHGAVYTPGPGLKQQHRHKPQHRGGQHHTVKSKGKLGYALRKQGTMVGPVPGNLKGPQKRHRLP